MRCDEVRTALDELVDGTLDGETQRTVERHLDGCPACRALAGDLRAIRSAASTLERRQPPALAWTRLEAALRQAADRPAPATRRRTGPVWLAAAAALVLATAAGVVPLVQERLAGPATPGATAPAAVSGEALVQNVAADLAAAEAHYQKAIAGLEQIARTESGALDPQVAAVLQENLRVIDHAIGESRAALQAQPSSAPAQASLFDAMRDKVALLQQTVELINEMRKGNQAEAGRLIEGLNR